MSCSAVRANNAPRIGLQVLTSNVNPKHPNENYNRQARLFLSLVSSFHYPKTVSKMKRFFLLICLNTKSLFLLFMMMMMLVFIENSW
jgi:hypothetical protein